MLYIADPDGSVWLEVVEVLAEREALDIVACIYPDSPAEALPAPFARAAAPEPLELPREYPGGGEPPCSSRLTVSSESIDDLRSHVGEFEDWADSLSLHPPRERAWVAAFIPHERVVLVRDVRLQAFLDAAGIEAGTERPDGW